MENFVVSARKYRPITFDSVVGQSHITTTLKNAIRTNHLASAFLFCGPRGVGKTTCARILAKTINCQALSSDAEACGTCDSCVAFQQNASFNVHELDAASNNSVEDIRNLIDQVRYPPQAGSKKKIYIIDEVHMLSTSAFNAFLKTLEEPPSYAIFILATTEKHKILPTILSRCQIFDFNRIQNKDIADHLAIIAQKENVSADYQALELIAQKADGGLRDALSMFDLNVTFSKDNSIAYSDVLENLHILDYDYYFKMTDALLNQSMWQAFSLYDDILSKGFDGHQFVIGLLGHLRDLLVCKDVSTIKLLQVSESVAIKYKEQSQKASVSFLISALSVGSQCDINYKSAKNQRLHVEIFLSKLANIPAVLDLSNLSEDEKKKPSPVIIIEEKTNTQTENTEIVAAPSPVASSQNEVEISKIKTSKLKSTFDLDDLGPDLNKTLVQETSAPVILQNKAFSKTELISVWQAFTNTRESLGEISEVVILKRDFDLEGTTIRIKLDNNVQKGLLEGFKTLLMSYLRENLQNTGIQLIAEISIEEQTSKPYTQAEKFNFMAEKNPHLIELRNALGLELGY